MTEQMEITLETLKARVASSSAYAMDMFEQAHSYTLTDLVGFVGSHDPACVWAVLLGQNAHVEISR